MKTNPASPSKSRKAQKVKAVHFDSLTFGSRWELPATPDAYAQMVWQIADALAAQDGFPKDMGFVFQEEAAAALKSIGIKAP